MADSTLPDDRFVVSVLISSALRWFQCPSPLFGARSVDTETREETAENGVEMAVRDEDGADGREHLSRMHHTGAVQALQRDEHTGIIDNTNGQCSMQYAIHKTRFLSSPL